MRAVGSGPAPGRPAAGPAGVRPAPPRTPPAALVVALLSLAGYLAARLTSHPTSIDLIVYRAEGRALLDGADLYGPLPVAHGLQATYPPFAALLFTSVAVLPLSVAIAVVCALNVALLLLVARLAVTLTGTGASRWPAALLLFAAGLWAEPVFTTLRYGQINLALLALVLADFTVLSRSRAHGVATGVAAGLKLTPAVFVVYLLLTRRFRAAATAAGAFAATAGVGAAVLPHASLRFWTGLLFDSARVGHLQDEANQSVRGWLVRVAHQAATTPVEVAATGLVALAGLVVAGYAHRRLGDAWGLPAAAVTGLLVSPITWTHHWVWCVPLAALLRYRRPAWLALVAVFWSYAVWLLPHEPARDEFRDAPWQVALSGLYVVAGVLFLALTLAAARAGRHPGVRAD